MSGYQQRYLSITSRRVWALFVTRRNHPVYDPEFPGVVAGPLVVRSCILFCHFALFRFKTIVAPITLNFRLSYSSFCMFM